MEYAKAVTVLKELLEKKELTADEKEALMTAIGVLSLGALGIGKIKAKYANRNKQAEW
jgi:hypothetical protein